MVMGLGLERRGHAGAPEVSKVTAMRTKSIRVTATVVARVAAVAGRTMKRASTATDPITTAAAPE